MTPRYKVVALAFTLALLFGLLGGSVVSARTLEQQVSFEAPKLVVNTSFLNVRKGPGVGFEVLVTVVGGTELPVLGTFGDGVWYQVATDGGPGWVNVEFTLPRGDFTNVPLVAAGEVGDPGRGGGAVPVAAIASGRQVTGFSLAGGDLRAEPSYNALIIRSALPVDPTVVYPLLGQTRDASGVNWYLINVPGTGTGWVDKIELRLLECGSDQVSVTNFEVPIVFDGIANRQSFLLPAGTEGYIGARRNNVLIEFRLVDSTLGLVPVDAISARSDVTSVCTGIASGATDGQGGGAESASGIVPTGVTGNRVVVNTGNLNIRSGPGAEFSVVATVPGGTTLKVLGRAPDGVWYLIEGPFGQGWLNVQFALFRGDFSSVSVVDEAAAVNLGQGGGATAANVSSGRQVTGVSLLGSDIRTDPNFNALKLRSAVPADPFTVYPLLGTTTDANGVNWYLLRVGDVTGWTDKAQLRLLQCGTDSVGVTQYEVPIVFDGIANRQSFLIPAGTEGYILGRRGVLVLFELVDGNLGLIPADAVQARTGVTSVCEGVAAITAAPATGSSGAVITPPPAAPTGNRIVVNTGNLNVRSGPNGLFSVVATVPGGTELAVTGRSRDGAWYLVQGAFGQGWVDSEFVLFRGDYGSVPVVDV